MATEEYNKEEEEDLIAQLSQELNDQTAKNQELHNSLSTLTNSNNNPANIAEYQIETISLLKELRDFYSGKYEDYDEEGNVVLKIPEDDELIPFNSYGVNTMMEIITKYINKNTILSYYDEERIYQILGDLGIELILLISCNHRKMGLNTPFKKSKFRVIVVSTLHMIESSYRRSIRGRTSKQVNESKIINQSENLNFRNHSPEHQSGFKFKDIFRR